MTSSSPLYAIYVLLTLAVVVISGIVVWASLLLGPARLIVVIALGLATLAAFIATVLTRHDVAVGLYLLSAVLWLFAWSHGPLTLLPGLLLFLGLMMASSYFASRNPANKS